MVIHRNPFKLTCNGFMGAIGRLYGGLLPVRCIYSQINILGLILTKPEAILMKNHEKP